MIQPLDLYCLCLSMLLLTLKFEKIKIRKSKQQKKDCFLYKLIVLTISSYFPGQFLQQSIVGSVVECSPATRAARVRFPDDAFNFFPLLNF